MEILILMMSSAVNNYIHTFLFVCFFCYFFLPGDRGEGEGEESNNFLCLEAELQVCKWGISMILQFLICG